MTNEELIKAAEIIKEHCDKCDCDDCLFSINYECMFGGSPNYWEVTKPRRWTDADIALAKALKAFGAKEVYRTTMRGPQRRWRVDDMQFGVVPDGAFMALEKQECVSLDDIIKEGENND